MKGKMLLFGTIALALVFGLFFTGCDDPPAKDETTYTVSFNSNGGSGIVPPPQEALAGSSITLPDGSGLSRTGYTFGGWNTNAAGTETNYNAGSDYTVTGNVTLYAKWNPVSSVTTYTVSFNANGGSGSVQSITVDSGSSITLPDGSGLSRTGYTFGGWNTNTAGTGTNYSADASYTVTGNVTLYAMWIPIYTVTFNANGGSGTAPAAQTANSGSSITLPDGSGLSRTDYTFGGWNTNTAGTGTNYSADSSYTVTQNITLYAKWTLNPYTVTFNSNEGSSVQAQSVNSGGTATRPENPTRSGYTFDNWYSNSDLTTVYNFSTAVTGNITLYAKWTLNPYIVTFNSNEGSSVQAQSVNSGGTATRPATPTRSGYTFDNWYSDSDLTSVYNFSTAVTGHITLYAKWYPQGSVVITIGFIPDAAPVITGPTIYISGDGEDTPSSATITLENPARYNSINWYIPGTGINVSGASITLSAENTDYNTPGEHALTVEVKINGIPYGRTIIFTVEEVEEEG